MLGVLDPSGTTETWDPSFLTSLSVTRRNSFDVGVTVWAILKVLGGRVPAATWGQGAVGTRGRTFLSSLGVHGSNPLCKMIVDNF